MFNKAKIEGWCNEEQPNMMLRSQAHLTSSLIVLAYLTLPSLYSFRQCFSNRICSHNTLRVKYQDLLAFILGKVFFFIFERKNINVIYIRHIAQIIVPRSLYSLHIKAFKVRRPLTRTFYFGQ